MFNYIELTLNNRLYVSYNIQHLTFMNINVINGFRALFNIAAVGEEVYARLIPHS